MGQKVIYIFFADVFVTENVARTKMKKSKKVLSKYIYFQTCNSIKPKTQIVRKL